MIFEESKETSHMRRQIVADDTAYLDWGTASTMKVAHLSFKDSPRVIPGPSDVALGF
jgi:hypothetical protein